MKVSHLLHLGTVRQAKEDFTMGCRNRKSFVWAFSKYLNVGGAQGM